MILLFQQYRIRLFCISRKSEGRFCEFNDAGQTWADNFGLRLELLNVKV